MTFCSKCGTQLQDGATFCPNCGTQQQAQPQPQQQAQPQPQQQARPAAGAAGGIFKFPTLGGWVILGAATLAFFLMFIPWMWGYGVTSSNSFGVLSSGIGYVSGIFVIPKIFLILNIFVFPAFIAVRLLDVGKLIPALSKINLKFFTAIGFYGLYALSLIFALLGIIVTHDLGISAGWFVSLILSAPGAVVAIMPGILTKISPKLK